IFTIGSHDIYFEIPIALRTENDLLPIRRITPFGIITRSVCQASESGAVKVRLKHIHERVEIPLVAPTDPRLPILFTLRELFRLMLPRVGIQVAAGEDDFFAGWMKVGASGLADARAHAPVFTTFQLHDKDLVEWVVALFFRLEDNLLAVRGEIALAGTYEVVGKLLDVVEMDGLELLPIGRWLLQQGKEEEGKR